MPCKGIRVRYMTIGVSKNRLLSIWNAAMQHLLLSQCHQKFPYPQRNGYNPFPMALGVALNNLPGCAAAGTADGQFTSTGYVPPLQSTQFPTPQSGRDCQCVVRPIQNCFVLNACGRRRWVSIFVICVSPSESSQYIFVALSFSSSLTNENQLPFCNPHSGTLRFPRRERSRF